MTWVLPLGLAAAPPGGMGSIYDLLVSGGPIMVPIGLCSVIALGFTVDRWLRLRSARLGNPAFGRALVQTIREGGVMSGLALCEQRPTPLARILAAGLRRVDSPAAEMEKAVEDAGGREVKRLSTSLRPLLVVATIAPLLGLLGTVWGMILAFSSIAHQQALGKPELLASAISQALVTTAAGLVVAIPVQALYHHFRGRIDRFTRLAEGLYEDVAASLHGKAVEHAHPR